MYDLILWRQEILLGTMLYLKFSGSTVNLNMWEYIEKKRKIIYSLESTATIYMLILLVDFCM